MTDFIRVVDALEIESFVRILYRIRDNDRAGQPSFTHKQIRVYLECINDLWKDMQFLNTPQADYYQPEIKFLLRGLSCRISHEKRGFLAERLIDLLENIKKSAPQNKSKDFDDSNF